MAPINARENLFNALAAARDAEGRFARPLDEARSLIEAYDLETASLYGAELEKISNVGRDTGLRLLLERFEHLQKAKSPVLRRLFTELTEAVDEMTGVGTIKTTEQTASPEVMPETGKEDGDEGEEAAGHPAG